MFKICVHHGSLEVFMPNAGLHMPCKTMGRLTKKNDTKPYKLHFFCCRDLFQINTRCATYHLSTHMLPCCDYVNSRNAILSYLGDKYGMNGSTEAQKIRTQEPPSLRPSDDRGDMSTDGTKNSLEVSVAV